MEARQTPTFERLPMKSTTTDGPMGTQLASAFFGDPLPWQQHVLDVLLARDARDKYAFHAVALSVPRQNGKMLAESTEIPTPDGWKRLGDIRVGDYVFGDDGKPAMVVAKYEPDEPNHYEIDFGNAGNFVNETVKAGGGHLWEVMCGDWSKPHVVDTDWLYENFAHVKGKRQAYSVKLSKPVEYQKADLLIDPYMLGVWLGDGCAQSCEITCHISDSEHYISRFAEAGFDSEFIPKTGFTDVGNVRVDGLRPLIHELGLYDNKRIPQEYLTASVEQRMELLRGLMDTDGSAEHHSTRVSFCQSGRPELVSQIMELVASLGMKPHYRVKELHKQNPNAKDAQEVYFNAASSDVFSLPRKRETFEKYATKPQVFNKWYIKDIRPIKANERYFCLSVANRSHLFLCTRSYIPTHNSWDARSRCFYGIVAEGEKILYTCQHGDTADEMFRDLSNVFEDEDNTELHAMLKAVRKTNGQQAIYLENGGYIRFTTRTNSLARGRSYDVIVYDEAQELTAAQQAASLPTISASSKHNTQVIYLGTPPNPECPGTVFTAMHDKAHGDEEPPFAWMEWAVSEIGDVSDRARWYETNPSLGTLIEETAIEGELSMSPEDFARERLGWWTPSRTSQAAIPNDLWSKTQISSIGTKYRKKTALAVKFTADGSSYALAGAKMNSAGDVAFELVELGTTAGGTKALAEALYARRRKAACVVVDGLNGAGILCEQLDALGCPRGYVVRPNAGDVITAATGLLNGMKDGTTSHTGQQMLNDSATNATVRPIGHSGGWGFGSDGMHKSEPIEACALAVWAVRTTKRNPARKQVML